jgi:acetyltransferase-like isoleucine patch superfamily enzyme
VAGRFREVRRIPSSIRLAAWRISTTARLRLRGFDCEIRLGRRVSFDALPVLKLRIGPRGGGLFIDVGDDVDLGSMLILDVKRGTSSSLTVGPRSQLEHAVRMQLWGGSVCVGVQAEVRDNAVLKVSAPDAHLHLHDQVKVGRGAAIHCQESVVVGGRSTIAERVTVVDSFHDVDGSDVWTMEQPLGSAPVVIGSNVLVLSGAVVVHGTAIGNNAVVCANALVGTGSYGPGVVLLGNPARAVRKLSPAEHEAASG